MFLPTLYSFAKFGHSRSNHTSVSLWDSPENFDTSRPAFQGHLTSLELTRIDRIHMTSYQWAIVTMGLSRRVSEINSDFGRKSQIFTTLVYLTPPLRESIVTCGSVAEWLGRWTCDQQVASSNPDLSAIECNPGQVVNTHVPLSPSSTIWYQPMSSDALRLGR